MASQFIMQKYMTPTTMTDDAQGKTTQQITLVMTFMFGFFTLQVPAGLTLYWVTSNLLQMLQQWYMMSRTTLIPATATAGSSASRTTVPGTSTAVSTKSVGKPVMKPATKPTTVKSTASSSSSSAAKRKASK
jgi:YidC/Oxa1 family membrane protein insertase